MRHHLILRVITKLLVGTIFLFALYVQFHGDYSPGGGFQAGVIMAVGFMIFIFFYYSQEYPLSIQGYGNMAGVAFINKFSGI